MERKQLQARYALEELEELKSQVYRQQRAVRYLESKCTASTRHYRTPTGTRIDGPSDLWSKLSDQKEELEAMSRHLTRQQKQLEQWIDLLPKPRWRMVLRYHYLDNLELNEVADLMSKATGRNFSMHQIYRLHAQALQAADKLWPLDRPCVS